MKKLISFEQAVLWSLILFGIFFMFHLSIIIGIIAFDFVPLDFLWGGQMESKEQLLVFEGISLFILSLCFLLVLIRSGRVHFPTLVGFSRIALWVLFALFLLNTVGNIFAKTTFEKVLTIVTLALAILCFRLASEPLGKRD